MLKNYRIENTNITQEKMAQYLNISLRTYQRIEKENNCKLSIAKEISTIFNNSIEKIFFE